MASNTLVVFLLLALMVSSSTSSPGHQDHIDEQNILNWASDAQTEPSSFIIRKTSLSADDTGNRKLVLMMLRPQENCVPEGNHCGPAYWCCAYLACPIFPPYRCHRASCVGKGQFCGALPVPKPAPIVISCCQGYTCKANKCV